MKVCLNFSNGRCLQVEPESIEYIVPDDSDSVFVHLTDCSLFACTSVDFNVNQENPSPITKLVCDAVSVYEHYRNQNGTKSSTMPLLGRIRRTVEEFNTDAVYAHMKHLKENADSFDVLTELNKK